MTANVRGLYEVGVFKERMLNLAPKFIRITKSQNLHISPNFIKPLLYAVYFRFKNTNI